MEPDPLRAEWARWLVGIRRIFTAASVLLAMVVASLLVVMIREITRPSPPRMEPDPRETMSKYLEAIQRPSDTQPDVQKE
jgi:hypothetical protein